ncbi:HNH endonuclease signature motif containing protein [Jiangella endophytica]|uniref:HNH endonuclease signature motif containing protein n=1 Tax=Jiangella endophytica TaxID=1623398 RepID=UPI0018E597F1|nr:HNH endonuclease signature motif containing protein [Jiangella endophytica]
MSNPIDRLAMAPPGAELAALLACIDLTALSPHDLIVAAQARQRQLAHEEAALLRVFAELAGRPEYQRCGAPPELASAHMHRAVEAAGDEVSLALRWSPGRATARVALAVELLEDLPETFEALAAGRLDADKARLIADRTRCLAGPVQRRQVEAAVLPDAETRTWWSLDRSLRREVIIADPTGAEDRRRRAAERRYVGRPEPAAPGGEDGMATLMLCGPAEDLAALWTATDAAARHARASGESRTLDQLRFDLLTGLGWTALESGHLGCCHPTCTARDPAPTPAPTPAGHPRSTFLSRPAHPTTPDRPANPGTPGIPGHPSTPRHPTSAGQMLQVRPADRAAADDTDPDPLRRAPAAPSAIAASSRPVAPGTLSSPGHPTSPGTPTDSAATARPAARAHPAGPVVLGRSRGEAAAVLVTVPIDVLTGAQDAPGELAGFGPITAGTARRIAGDATVRRLLTDPADGRLLEYGRATYAPPAGLAAHVVARDRTCRFPTCHRPATESEIDHQVPFAQGGNTGPDNTWALHGGHHRAKTWHGFAVTTDSQRTTWWITPAGRRYPVAPEVVGPIRARPPADGARQEVVPF